MCAAPQSLQRGSGCTSTSCHFAPDPRAGEVPPADDEQPPVSPPLVPSLPRAAKIRDTKHLSLSLCALEVSRTLMEHSLAHVTAETADHGRGKWWNRGNRVEVGMVRQRAEANLAAVIFSTPIAPIINIIEHGLSPAVLPPLTPADDDAALLPMSPRC